MFETIVEQLHALPTAVKGRQFERLVAWYLESAPEYRNLVSRVYSWDKWPGRWGADAGIDLVVVTKTGDLWAVQAKAYSPDYSIKKADVDSFLSESNRREFSFRLLVATTDHLGDRAARTIHEQEKPVGLKLLSQLRHEELRWPDSLERLQAPAPAPLKPRPHQVEAINALVVGLGVNDRGQLLMACGTGKTLIGLWLDEALSSRRTLVIVPSLSLLGQTLRAWTAQATKPFDYLAVCSDETVTASDSFTSRTADLGVPVTTDAEVIRAFLSERGARRVVFSTYHSSPVIASAQDAGGRAFDLAIVDEAHRAAGRVDSSFGTVLDANRIRVQKRVFMTATPRFVSSQIRTAARGLDVEVTSMDDPATFGRTLHHLSFGQAIKRELLTDYRVVVIGVDDPGVGRSAERRELLSIGHRTTDAETLARQVGLLRAIDRFGLKRSLTFHSRKATARSFAQGLYDVLDWLPHDERPSGHMWARHITGEMNAGERSVLLDQLRALEDADWGVLSNVRCVAEGIDVPTLDGVVFVDPRRGQIDVIQAVGRVIRKSPEKTLGIVVIPVFIPRGTEDEKVLNSSEFQKVWAVVRALRAHDDVLAEELDGARYKLGRRSGPVELPGKIILDLPRTVSPDFARALSARIVEQSTSSFEFWFGLLRQYVDERGSAAEIQKGTVVDGHRLGQWTDNQRQLYHASRMKAERLARLEATPGWTWRKREIYPKHDWEYSFRLLKRYVDEHGTALVPRKAVVNDVRLGAWIGAQRQRYASGELSADQIARLEQLPGWVWNTDDSNWDRMFALLERYVEETGIATVPRDHVEDGESLGRWVRKQRNVYNGVHPGGRLTKAQITKLVALPGWAWDLQDDKWERAFRALLSFVEREGHVKVRQRHKELGVNLGAWVIRQQIEYQKERLQRQGDRLQRLEAVPGWKWWLPTPDRWERNYAVLVKFEKREGHVDVPVGHVEDGVTLWRWVGYQRDRYTSGHLKKYPERIARLEALPGWRWRQRSTSPLRSPKPRKGV